MTKSFSEYLPYPQFLEMAKMALEWGRTSHASSEVRWKYQAAVDAHVTEPFKRYMADLHATGKLTPLDLKGHDNADIEGWNTFVETGNPATIPSLDSLSDDLLFGATYPLSKALQEREASGLPASAEDAFRAAYAALVRRVDACDALRSSSVDCWRCGTHIRLGYKGWQLTLSNDPDYRKTALAPCTFDAGLKEIMIRVTSGEILAADWVRIGEFTEAVKENKPTLSINYAAGEVALTRHYAENFSFISVYVGNSMPRVYVNNAGDEVVAGRVIENADGDGDYFTTESWGDFTSRARICTDLWWATLIDPAQLTAVLSKAIGAEAASKVVDEYLEKGKHEFTRIPLQNGTYRVRFGNQGALETELRQAHALPECDEHQLDFHMTRISD